MMRVSETIENHTPVPPHNLARPRIPQRPNDWFQIQNPNPKKRKHLDSEVFCVFSVPVTSTFPKSLCVGEQQVKTLLGLVIYI